VVSLVGFADVKRCAIWIRIDGHGGDSQFAASAYYSNCNLTTVGNEYLLEHF
jgi:hypothetical protein